MLRKSIHVTCKNSANEPHVCDSDLTGLMNEAIDTAYSKSFNVQLLSANVTLFPGHSLCDEVC